MAAPNIVNVSNIFGKTQYANVTTVYANVITNSSTSNTVIKVNEITLSNYTGSSVVGSVRVGRGSDRFFVAGNVTIPANSVLVVLAKDTSLYLEEGDFLQANVSSNVAVHMSTSYEEIS